MLDLFQAVVCVGLGLHGMQYAAIMTAEDKKKEGC